MNMNKVNVLNYFNYVELKEYTKHYYSCDLNYLRCYCHFSDILLL